MILLLNKPLTTKSFMVAERSYDLRTSGLWAHKDQETIVEALKSLAGHGVKVEAQKEEIQRLYSELDSFKEENQYLKNKLDYKRNVIEDLEQEINAKDYEVKQIKENFASKEEEFNELEKFVVEKVEEINILREKNLSMVNQIGKNIRMEKKIDIQNNVIKELRERRIRLNIIMMMLLKQKTTRNW